MKLHKSGPIKLARPEKFKSTISLSLSRLSDTCDCYLLVLRMPPVVILAIMNYRCKLEEDIGTVTHGTVTTVFHKSRTASFHDRLDAEYSAGLEVL